MLRINIVFQLLIIRSAIRYYIILKRQIGIRPLPSGLSYRRFRHCQYLVQRAVTHGCDWHNILSYIHSCDAQLSIHYVGGNCEQTSICGKSRWNYRLMINCYSHIIIKKGDHKSYIVWNDAHKCVCVHTCVAVQLPTLSVLIKMMIPFSKVWFVHII